MKKKLIALTILLLLVPALRAMHDEGEERWLSTDVEENALDHNNGSAMQDCREGCMEMTKGILCAVPYKAVGCTLLWSAVASACVGSAIFGLGKDCYSVASHTYKDCGVKLDPSEFSDCILGSARVMSIVTMILGCALGWCGYRIRSGR